MQTAERNNVRVIRPFTELELTAWRRWFPRRDVRHLVGRYCELGGYICLPGGRAQLEDQPWPTPVTGPSGGGDAA